MQDRISDRRQSRLAIAARGLFACAPEVCYANLLQLSCVATILFAPAESARGRAEPS